MHTARSLIVSPYLIVSHACPPRSNHAHPPSSNHTCPPATMHAPRATMHTSLEQLCMCPWEQPCTPRGSNHTCPPGSNHAHQTEQPHTPPPPWEQPCMPPGSNYTCPRGATTHAPWNKHAHPPEQPCMPPKSNHARPPPCGQTDTCKNITFANFVCGR